MFLDLVDGNAYDLANVQLCHLNWSYSQQWKLISAGDGYYYIASRCNENYRLDAQEEVKIVMLVRMYAYITQLIMMVRNGK